jgi:hypothetical protein
MPSLSETEEDGERAATSSSVPPLEPFGAGRSATLRTGLDDSSRSQVFSAPDVAPRRSHVPRSSSASAREPDDAAFEAA